MPVSSNIDLDLDRLRRNDARMDSVQLPIQSGSDTSDIVSALSHATRVRKVSVTFYHLYNNSPVAPSSHAATVAPPTSCGSRKRSRSEAMQPDLLQAIGALPRLQEFHCSGGGLTMHTISVVSLMALLEEASQLEVLQLSRVQLQANSAQEFEDLADAFRGRTSLHAIALEDCKLVYHNRATNDDATTPQQRNKNLFTTPPFALDALLKAMATLPDLQSVKVTTKDNFFGIVSPQALEVLTCSSSLQTLILRGLAPWNAQHVLAIGPGVATSKTLKQLSLPNYGGVASSKVTDCVAYMLQDNTSLERFEMPTLSSPCKWVLVAAKILQTNTQLQVLQLGLSNNAHSHNDSIRFHLKLNQAGRSQLLAGVADHREWVKAMGKVKDDLDCVYYFLSRNPSLCCHPAMTVQEG